MQIETAAWGVFYATVVLVNLSFIYVILELGI